MGSLEGYNQSFGYISRADREIGGVAVHDVATPRPPLTVIACLSTLLRLRYFLSEFGLGADREQELCYY